MGTCSVVPECYVAIHAEDPESSREFIVLEPASQLTVNLRGRSTMSCTVAVDMVHRKKLDRSLITASAVGDQTTRVVLQDFVSLLLVPALVMGFGTDSAASMEFPVPSPPRSRRKEHCRLVFFDPTLRAFTCLHIKPHLTKGSFPRTCLIRLLLAIGTKPMAIRAPFQGASGSLMALNLIPAWIRACSRTRSWASSFACRATARVSSGRLCVPAADSPAAWIHCATCTPWGRSLRKMQ